MTDDKAALLIALEVRVAALEKQLDQLDLPMLQRRLGQLFGTNGHGEHGLLMEQLQDIRDAMPRPWTDVQKAIWALCLAVVLGGVSWMFRDYEQMQERQNAQIQQLSDEYKAMVQEMKQLQVGGGEVKR